FATKGGKLTGTLDSPDQKAEGIAMDEITLKGSSVRFEIEMINGKFEGKLAKDGAELAGRWKQGGMDLPLTFKRQSKKAGKGLEGVWQGALPVKQKVRLLV